MSEKPRLPRSIVVLNVIMIVIILAICALVISLVYSPAILGEQQTSASSSSAVGSESGTSASTTVTTTTVTTTTSVSMTKASQESTPAESTTAPQEYSQPQEVTVSAYDRDFFSNDLFIGDSITTGLHLYNKLDMKNVAASVGYTPYKAYTTPCDLYDGTSATAVDYAKSMQPKRIYVMLGSNGLLSAGAMENSYITLLDKLAEACPKADIYCISVTPVAQYTSYDITMDMVNEFNAFVKKTCAQRGVAYIDFCSEMTGADGYAKADMVADDGLHFNGSTYNTMLAFIENSVS